MGSLGWLCLFNSLGCCNVQEAVEWRGAGSAEAPKFHNTTLGLDEGWGMTGAEDVSEVLHQRTHEKLEP